MKKIVAMLLSASMLLSVAPYAYADNTNISASSIQSNALIDAVIANPILNTDGKIDIDKTIEETHVTYTQEEYNDVVATLNLANDLIVAADIKVHENNSPLMMKQSVGTMGFPVGHRVISGAYSTGDNMIRVYYDQTDTRKMIEATGSGFGQWSLEQLGGIAASKFVLGPPAWFIVSFAQWIRSDEHETYMKNFSESREHGIYCEYWRYKQYNRIWGPWFRGDTTETYWERI